VAKKQFLQAVGTALPCPRLMRMTGRTLYESANGDIWRLVRDPNTGGPVVEHQPNANSGGRTSLIEIGHFLRAEGNGPQHQALLALIGTLIEG
jgi:hypothetical protein